MSGIQAIDDPIIAQAIWQNHPAGIQDYGAHSVPQTSAEGQFSRAYLTRYVDANGYPTFFTRTLPDGSVEKFTLPQGVPGVPKTKFFMTEIDDPVVSQRTIHPDYAAFR